MRIKPFAARRPRPGWELEIAAPPYDVLTHAEACALAKGHPHSMLHVTRPEIAFPVMEPPDDDVAHSAARKHYRELLADGRLIVEQEACYYLYEQQKGNHRQRGIVGLFHVADYRNGLIRRHEFTRRDKELDRTRLLRKVGAQPGLVFLACRDTAGIDEALGMGDGGTWLYDFEAADGAFHRVMPLPRNARVEQALASTPVAYIADGHHRAAAAAAAAKADGTEDHPANWFPAALFPARALNVCSYHRCVRSLGDMHAAGFLAAARDKFKVLKSDVEAPLETGCIRFLTLKGCWDLRLQRLPRGVSVASRLDAAVLQDHLLQPLLGIDDPRACANLDFLGGANAVGAIERGLREATFEAAFLMAPVPVDVMMRVADEGETMPPKSTWFDPKLLEGLLVHDRES